MCTQGNTIQQDCVSDEETYTRWVYVPRYRNNKGEFNHAFISLREWPDRKEEGISGQIIDRASHTTVLLWGLKFRRPSKDGTHKEERFTGYAKALAGKIRSIVDEEGDKVDVILTESEVPYHAEIKFEIDGDCIVGNNQHPKFLRYKDKLREILEKDVYEASLEEIAEVKSILEKEKK